MGALSHWRRLSLRLTLRIDKINTPQQNPRVEVRFELNGATFVWDDEKARLNLMRHPGVSFEAAAEVFFDPFVRLVDASRNDEARHAAIGYDVSGRLLFVVHVEIEDEFIRVISARKATMQEREDHVA